MSTEFTWNIPTLEYFPSLNGLDQVVHMVHWVLIGNDGTYQSSIYGTQTINTDNINPEKYIPYDQLTPAIVTEWLVDSFGPAKVSELQNIVQQNINNMIDPPNVIAAPPWDQNNPTGSASL